MQKIFYIAGLGIILSGCCTEVNTIQLNQFYQENYNSICVREGTTWSELVLCLQKDLESEHKQNEITNSLLNQDK